MNEPENPFLLKGAADFSLDIHVSAFSCHLRFGPDVPSLYRRTFALGVFLGPVVAAFAGLFDYDADVWRWSKREGFKMVKLTKRSIKS